MHEFSHGLRPVWELRRLLLEDGPDLAAAADSRRACLHTAEKDGMLGDRVAAWQDCLVLCHQQKTLFLWVVDPDGGLS
jgi:hypothetical protein